jgi:hypothetical protein
VDIRATTGSYDLSVVVGIAGTPMVLTPHPLQNTLPAQGIVEDGDCREQCGKILVDTFVNRVYYDNWLADEPIFRKGTENGIAQEL